jgi:hypothetical protein
MHLRIDEAINKANSIESTAVQLTDAIQALEIRGI